MLRGPKNWTELLVAVLLIPVGLVAVSFGLYRARLAPTWTTGKLGVGGPLFAVGLAAMAIGMAPIGWRVPGETDERWEHPPLSTSPAT